MELNLKLSIVRGVLLSLLVAICIGNAKASCATVESPLLRLRQHLFCNYDAAVRPIKKHNTTITVNLILTPMRIDFIDKSSRFILHTWVSWTWRDEFLIWNPEDFDGVYETSVKSTEVWTPDFSLYNSAEMTETQIGMSNVPCMLTYNGILRCNGPIKYDSHCGTDFRNWPYDQQICKLFLGSWVHLGDHIDINLNKSKIDMENYFKNDEWDLKNSTLVTEVEKNYGETYLYILPSFIMWRHPSAIHTIYVTSTHVFAVITLIALCLDSRSIERILLATMNFCCHALFIFMLHWEFSKNGERKSPNLLTFYRHSWIIVTFTIVLTMLLRRLQSCKETPPKWIVFVGSLVACNRITRFLLLAGKMEDAHDIKQLINSRSLSNENEDQENNCLPNPSFQNSSKSHANDSWRRVAIIIERLAFICIALTYLLLIILLVPRARSEYVNKV